MFDSAKLMYATGGGAGFYDHTIDQSLRINDDDSAYLSRTPASAGNRKTWTWSGWVKRGNLGTFQNLFGVSTFSTNNWAYFHFRDGDSIQFNTVISGTDNTQLITTPVYRDTSAWYHIVLAFDTTQATPSNRVKIYVNGLQVTAFNTATYPAQNHDAAVNTTNPHMLGRWDTSRHFDGYLAEVNFIDGQALDPTSFGEFKSGVWIPKAYSGSYGTNGFYLDFDGTFYNDKSGNGNNFTANNLAATDVVLDSPTNNFCTLNPLDNDGKGEWSEGNTKWYLSESVAGVNRSTFSVNSGKWYWEILNQSGGGRGNLGIIESSETVDEVYNVGSNPAPDAYGYFGVNGYKYHNNSSASYGATYGVNDIIGVALDMDAGTITFYKNNATQGQAYSSISGTYSPAVGKDQSGTGKDWTFVANFGQDSSFAGNKTAQGNTDDNGYGDFYYAPPSGYLALCTANLPDPVASIDPAQDGSPQDHFNTVLYTGNGTSGNAITGVGFQPDLVWVKRRSSSASHRLWNSVVGTSTALASNLTNGDISNALVSFDADGFTLGSNTTENSNGETYVAWNWKANGSGVSNTDGSITTTVRPNTAAGFSIVKYYGTKASATVGHGLDAAPELIICKTRDATRNWGVYSKEIGYTKHLRLNTTDAAVNIDIWSADPTSSVFSLGVDSLNNNQENYIAYCFHSVDGFSKFGSYTGNGSTDGPFCYTGFRPALVITKVTNTADNWTMADSVRSTSNVIDDYLLPNSSAAEVTNSVGDIDFLSNGFKLRSSDSTRNRNGDTHIYMAFAEMPAKYSLGR